MILLVYKINQKKNFSICIKILKIKVTKNNKETNYFKVIKNCYPKIFK